ncbi:MAG: hypothetical protein RRA92_01505 [Gemmatimonadota bacterium]|nr:hypothetical protein [Gemmatimonadota bacterium]
MNEQPLTLDVLLERGGLRRGARVAPEPGGLSCDGVDFPWSDVFFVSRRAGMLLLFGSGGALVARGPADALDRLDGWVGKAVDQSELRRRLVRQLGHEVVLFTAGCTVQGRLDGQPVRGLYVAAATRRGLHLVSGREQWILTWPVDRVRRRLARQGAPGGDALLLARGESELQLRYLFPEEIIALSTAARRAPPPRAGGGTSLELFRRADVAPPPPADLPEFSRAAASLPAVAERAAANVPADLQVRALMPPDFFDLHFRELGETVLGPLLVRKSAARGAAGLRPAVDALNAAGLAEDTRAAIDTATERTLSAYDEQLDRLLAMRRGPARVEREARIDAAARQFLHERLQAPFERLWARFEGLEEQEERLVALLDAVQEGPPGEDDAELGEAAAEWRATLDRLDGGCEAAWRELVEEVEKTWSTDFLPRLARVATLEVDELPEWIKLAALGLLTLFIAAALVILVIR